MTNPNQLPTYTLPLNTKGQTTKAWYTFFAGVFTGQPGSSVASVTVGTTPFIYQAERAGTLFLSGGTTSTVTISRDGKTFYPTGVLAGSFPLRQGDQLSISYSVGPPTVTWVPI